MATTDNTTPTASQTGANSFYSTFNSQLSKAGYGAANPVSGNSGVNNNENRSPTIVTDANTREQGIPNIVSTSKSLGALPADKNGNQPFKLNTAGSPTPDNSDGTGNAGGLDANSSYNDIFNSVFNGQGNTVNDPINAQILDNLRAMRANSDALSGAQIDAIHSGFQARQQLLQRENQSTTGMLGSLLESSGSFRTGSAAAILDAKDQNDIQSLVNLDNEERSAKAAVYKAQQEQDFQAMDKMNATLKDIQDKKYNRAKDIADKITEKNQNDRNYNLQVEQFNHTSEKDKVTQEQEAERIQQGKYEFRDLKDSLGNTIGTQVIDKSTGRPISNISEPGNPTAVPGSNAALMPVSLGSDGQPNTTQQATFLNTLPPPVRALVQGLIDYRGQPPNPRTTSGQKLISLAEQADPTFDSGQWAVRQKVNMDYTSGKTATNIKSLNTSINHTGDLARDFVNLPNSDITKFNSVKEWFASNVGKGEPTKVINDLNALGGELAKTYKGTAGTDTEIANIEKGININSSPAQFKAFIESSMNLLGGRVSALDESYTQAVGKSIGHSLLNPSTAKILTDLKNHGYDIQVPGVKFSDKDAYMKATPDAKDKLTSAYNQLKSAGLPTTPENVLQAAQEL